MARPHGMRSEFFVLLVIAGCADLDPDDLSSQTAAAQVCGTSLQAAIDVAPQDAVIEICAGTYRERLSIDGKRVELRGTSGAAVTTIDAGGLGRALTVRNVGGTGVRVTGLTLRNGVTSSTGGGIWCRDSTLRVRDSVVIGHRAAGGGGLASERCALDIAATRFENNDAGTARGGGALLIDSSGAVVTSSFTGNRAEQGGGVAVTAGTVALVDNDVRGNSAHRGGGLFIGHHGRIAGNQIVDNESQWTAGGIYVDATAPTIEGNLVADNTSVNDGGGVYVYQGAPVLLDNVVTGNVAGDDGGGVRLFESSARLERNVIERNQATDGGGGVRVSHLPCTLIDNLIRDNRADQGGGLDLDNDSSVLRGGVIAGNQATNGGGVAASLYPWSGAVIEDVQILDNVATGSGGGLYLVDNTHPIAMRHLIVRGNRAASGAGMYVRSTPHTLASSLFDRNVATGNGGAIHAASGSTSPRGDLDFVVAYRNSAASGSALYSAASGLSLESSILAENTGTAVRVSVAPTFRYNDTWPRSFSGMADPTGASGNLSADPRFRDPAGGNFALGADSPAIDAGDPALRDPDGSRADMGMFGGPDGDAPPPPPGGAMVVLEADAHVLADQPGVNVGGATTLTSDRSPLVETYLRFRVTGAGTPTRARLQLTVTNGTADAPALHAATSTWDEATITWSSRPARTGVVADLGAVSAGTMVEYDVTSLITGDGVYTMALIPSSDDGFAAYSREGTTAPRLILTTGATAATAVLEADTYAAAATPATSFGSAGFVSADTSPVQEAYLRFRVTGATAPPSRARLRLVVTDATSDGPALHVADSNWTESTLTWNTRPPRSSTVVADLGAAAVGQVVEYDVSSVVTGDGVYSFALIPTSSSGFAASSREGSSPPQLILEP